jgi:hypothetical protein
VFVYQKPREDSQDYRAALAIPVLLNRRSILQVRRRGIGRLLDRGLSAAMAEKAYPKLIHYNSFSKGTHFAAWEQPQAFSEELRASCRSLR